MFTIAFVKSDDIPMSTTYSKLLQSVKKLAYI